jgi:transposase
MTDWLREWEVTNVAMESTGEYWKPVFNLLEGEFGVILVNASHVNQVPGRKTDVTDAEWLAELLSYGLLKASFIPPKPQRDLRDLTRHRVNLVQERARWSIACKRYWSMPISSWPQWLRMCWVYRGVRCWLPW